MFPVRDVIPTRTTPYVVLTLIALNAIAIAYALATSMATTRLVVYLGVNVPYLWLFGENVEDRLGHGRFIVFYLLCGAAATLTQAFAFSVNATLAGVGGATAGVVGAYLFMYPHSRFVVLVPLIPAMRVAETPAFYFVAIWFALQVSFGTLWAHAAAVAVGAGSVLLFRRPERLRVEWWNDVRDIRHDR